MTIDCTLARLRLCTQASYCVKAIGSRLFTKTVFVSLASVPTCVALIKLLYTLKVHKVYIHEGYGTWAMSFHSSVSLTTLLASTVDLLLTY